MPDDATSYSYSSSPAKSPLQQEDNCKTVRQTDRKSSVRFTVCDWGCADHSVQFAVCSSRCAVRDVQFTVCDWMREAEGIYWMELITHKNSFEKTNWSQEYPRNEYACDTHCTLMDGSCTETLMELLWTPKFGAALKRLRSGFFTEVPRVTRASRLKGAFQRKNWFWNAHTKITRLSKETSKRKIEEKQKPKIDLIED